MTTSDGNETLQFDLPTDILRHDVLEKYVGTSVRGILDHSDTTLFYTKEYITRSKAKLRGALMGLLKPTLVKPILKRLNIAEELFLYLFDQLNDTGTISRRDNIHSMKYVPSFHIKELNDRLIRFYKIDKCLEYALLTYFDIAHEKEYVKQLLHNENMIFLKGRVMDIEVKQRLEDALQECIASKSYLNVRSFLNFRLHIEDIETFLLPLLKNYNSSIILFDQTVFSNQFIDSIKEMCLPMIQEKSESVVISGKYKNLKKYLKKKVTKNEYPHIDNKVERSKQVIQDSSSDEVTPHSNKTSICLEIISTEDVRKTIKKTLKDKGLGKFVTRIAEYIKGHLNQTALAIAKEFSEKLFADAHNRKFTHYSAQNRINFLMNNINLYEKGLNLFPNDKQPQFIKYLLKSIGADVLSVFCKHAANQCKLSIQADVLSVEQRNKLIDNLSEEYMKPLCALNSVLAEHNMEQFYQAVDVCLSECGMILAKFTMKKERLLVHNHREKLLSNIKSCEEPALVLHLVVLVLFTIVTQNMLHASSGQVPLIILFLKSQLKEDDFDKVQKYHEMVEKYLTAADEEKESIHEKLKDDLPSLKSIVKKYNKIIEIE